MTPRGVSRIVMIVLMLFGPGLSSLFQLNYAYAAATPPAAQTTAIVPPTEKLSSNPAAPLAAPLCTNELPTIGNGGKYIGLAGRVVDSFNNSIGIPNVEVSLVKQVGGVESVILSTTTQSLGGAGSIGNFALGDVDLGDSTNTQNVTLKFEKINRVSEYFDKRYDFQTSVKLTITTAPGGAGNCFVTDDKGQPRLGSIASGPPGIPLYSLSGIAGRVSAAIFTPGDAITDETVPIGGATVEILTYTKDAGSNYIASPTVSASVTTDPDGYYRVGDLVAGSYIVRFKKTGLLPTPQQDGSYFRDGGFGFAPFTTFPTVYKIIPITVTTQLLGTPHSYIITAPDTTNPPLGLYGNGSYPSVRGINGHLVVPAVITGTIVDDSSVVGAPVAGARVELYDATGTINYGATIADGNGVYSFDYNNNVLPSSSYKIRAVPPIGRELLARWYLNPNPNANGTTFPYGDSIITTAPTANATPINIGNKDIRLVPGAKFTGQIQSTASVNLDGVRVQIFRASDPVTTAIPIDVSDPSVGGAYNTHALLEPGVGYRLGFLPQGASQTFVSAYCVGTLPTCNTTSTLGSSSVFTFAQGELSKVANIQLTQGARIQGNIFSNPAGDNLSSTGFGLQVQVYILGGSGPNLGQLFQTFQVGATNPGDTSIAYDTASLPPGTYRIQFVPLSSNTNTGYIQAYYKSGSATGTSTLASATDLTIAAINDPPQTGKNIALTQGGEIILNLRIRDKAKPSQFISATNTLVQLYGGQTLQVPTSQQLVSAGTTDLNGTIIFRGIPTNDPPRGNPFALQIQAAGYAAAWVTTTVGVTKTLFTLTSGAGAGIGSPLVLDFELSQGGDIYGRIYDPFNPSFPYTDTIIHVFDSNKQPLIDFSGPSVISPTTGIYHISLQPGQQYYLSFEPPAGSYFTLYYPNATSPNPSGGEAFTPLSLQPDQPLNGIDAVFVEKGRLQVTVLDNQNNPAPGATVNLFNKDRQFVSTGTANGSGVFTTTFLQSKETTSTLFNYFVSARVGAGVEIWYNQQATLALADAINLPGGSVISVTIKLTNLINITGTVLAHLSSGVDGPVSGATVTVINGATNVPIFSVNTNSSGVYQASFESVPSYTVKVEYKFNTSATVSSTLYYQNGTDGTADPLQATALSGSQGSKDVKFYQGASLTGKVTIDNIGVGAASVSVLDPANPGNIYAQISTSGDGTYTVVNLAPGSYKIKFVANVAGTFKTKYYLLNKTDGTDAFVDGSAITLIDRATQLINHNFSTLPPPPGCSVLSALPVQATGTNIRINFGTSCSGLGKIYYSTSPGFSKATAPFVAETISTTDHSILMPGTNPALTPETNYYIQVYVISGTQEIYYGSELLARTAAVGDKWYFAYGDTRNNSTVSNTEVLHIFNYNNSAVVVNIGYYSSTTSALATPVTKTAAVSANSRLDVVVSDPADPNGLGTFTGANGVEHATAVVAGNNQPIMVERSIYNLTKGMNNGGETNGSSAMPGTPTLNNDWTFPDGRLVAGNGAANYDTYYTIFNPDPLKQACVIPTFYASPGNGTSAPPASPVFIPANSRLKINVRSLATGALSTVLNNPNGFAARFSSFNCGGSKQMIVVEQQTLYNNNLNSDDYRKGETNMLGSIGDGQQWYFLETPSSKTASRTYALLNPNPTTAFVTFTVQLDNAPIPAINDSSKVVSCNGINAPISNLNPIVIGCSVPGYGKVNVTVKDANKSVVGRTFGMSIKIDSSQPIVAQRAIGFIWRQLPIADGIFGQLGVNRVASTWLFAAGSTTNNLTTKQVADMGLDVYNPNALQVRLRVTYYYDTGAPTVFTDYFLNGGARTTITPASRVTAGYPSIGPNKNVVAVKIESMDNVGNANSNLPIFAQRIMYWTWGSMINGGNAVFGYNPPGT